MIQFQDRRNFISILVIVLDRAVHHSWRWDQQLQQLSAMADTQSSLTHSSGAGQP